MNNSDTNQAEQLNETAVSKSVIFPTDLRIGNFVFADLYGETKILVESICSKNNDVFNSTTGEIPFTSLKPIPLTLQLYREIEIQLIRKGFYNTLYDTHDLSWVSYRKIYFFL